MLRKWSDFKIQPKNIESSGFKPLNCFIFNRLGDIAPLESKRFRIYLAGPTSEVENLSLFSL